MIPPLILAQLVSFLYTACPDPLYMFCTSDIYLLLDKKVPVLDLKGLQNAIPEGDRGVEILALLSS